MNSPNTVDEYLSHLPASVKSMLESIRSLVREIAPEAVELMNYGIPTFKLKGKNLVHFAAFKHHIGVYPSPAAIEAFKDELKAYKTSKGAIQFPKIENLPLSLIRELIIFRAGKIRGN